jgi:hypothetical protein
MATLVSSATRSPLPCVDALELTSDNLPKLLIVLREREPDTSASADSCISTSTVRGDMVMLDKALGTAERPEGAVLEHGRNGLTHERHPSQVARVTGSAGDVGPFEGVRLSTLAGSHCTHVPSTRSFQ